MIYNPLLKKLWQTILWVGIVFFGVLWTWYTIEYSLDTTTRVYDRAQVIDDIIEQEIDAMLLEFENTTVGQIVIITLPNLEWRTIEEVALNFGRENGIGDEQRNSGLVVLIAVEERQRRIEVWYGLEWLVTDLQANRLGLQFLVPAFRQWQYGIGLQNLANELVAVLSWEKELENVELSSANWDITILEIFIFGLFVAYFFGWMVGTWPGMSGWGFGRWWWSFSGWGFWGFGWGSFGWWWAWGSR